MLRTSLTTPTSSSRSSTPVRECSGVSETPLTAPDTSGCWEMGNGEWKMGELGWGLLGAGRRGRGGWGRGRGGWGRGRGGWVLMLFSLNLPDLVSSPWPNDVILPPQWRHLPGALFWRNLPRTLTSSSQTSPTPCCLTASPSQTGSRGHKVSSRSLTIWEPLTVRF